MLFRAEFLAEEYTELRPFTDDLMLPKKLELALFNFLYFDLDFNFLPYFDFLVLEIEVLIFLPELRL